MSERFEAIYQAALAGTPASLTFEAEGTAYVRRFCPEERLILLGGLGFCLGVAFAVWFDRRCTKKGENIYTITGYAPGQGHA